MQIEPKPEDPTVRVRRTQHGVAVTTKIPPFSAYDVSRALARIAWFTFSPEMRQRASHLLPWIRDEVTWDATLLLVGALKVDAHGGTKGPILAVSIPKAGLRDDMPWFDVRLTLGRTVFATILPGPSLTMSVSNSDALAIIGRKGELKEDLESTFEFYSKKLASLPPPAHEEIARSAYARYLARGGVNGDARADWLEAEQELLWAQFEAVSEVDERSSPVEDKD